MDAIKSVKKREIFNSYNGGYSSLGDNGQIVQNNNGMMTVLNASGIFIYDPKTLKSINTVGNGYSYIQPNLLSNSNLNLNQNENPFNLYQYFPKNLLDLTYSPGQSVSINNNIITITNSSGTYMGYVNDGKLYKMSEDNLPGANNNNIFNYNSNGGQQSLSVINGIIILTNSSGTFAGRAFDRLVPIE